jgi:hypothetical protein
MWASEGGHADTVRVLVELGASVEAVDKVNKHTRACARIHVLYQACVSYRLWSPPNYTLTHDKPHSFSRMPQRGSTALDLALANGQEEAAAVLRTHGAQVSLFFAAEKGMADEIAARIAAGQDVNARDQVILSVCMGR